MSDEVDRMPGWQVKDEIRTLRARLSAAQFVIRERERELLQLKGPCSTDTCSLHYAHAGPCDTRTDEERR